MIDKFLESIPLKLAGIFNPRLECKALRETLADGIVCLVFKLPKPMLLSNLQDAFDSTHGLVEKTDQTDTAKTAMLIQFDAQS